MECVCTNQTSAVLYISFIFVCVCQDPKLREVLGFGKGDNVEGKLVTVVHGNDLVNTSFLNFQAMQEDTAKVTTSPPSNHLLAFITPADDVPSLPSSLSLSPCLLLSSGHMLTL